MAKIIAENLPFERQVVSRAEALERFRSRGEKYKVEIIESIPEGEEVSYFQHGDFIDLCRGPHVERTGDIKAFKVLSFAGAYWRGDERNAQLQRVYGTAFPRRRSSTSTWRASKRRSAATTGRWARSWTCFRSTIWSARASRSGTRRARSSATRSRTSSERERPPRLRPGLHAARGARAAARDLGPPGALQGQPLRRDGAGRAALPRQADELSVPRRHLPLADAVVSRPAAALLRARHRVPLRALGRAPRPAARARPDHGRRPPLRARGSDRRRDRRLPDVRARDAGLFGFKNFKLYLATRPESFMGEPAVWDRAEAALRARPRGDRPAVRGRRGGRRVLRPQDRSQDQGCAGARVAVLDLPARLPDARRRSRSSTSPRTAAASARS